MGYMPSSVSRYNTVPQDIESYQEERKRFLEYYGNFRNGNPNYSLPTINSLESMYMELVFGIHNKRNSEESALFLDALQEIRTDMTDFICKQQPEGQDKEGKPRLRVYLKNKNYQELLSSFSKVYVSFKKIKAECEMG